MPKPIQYRANSIIYFKGDASDKIFILNSGKISLNYIDIENGQEVHDLIKMGEFFGVKSALGRYPREETAVVLQDSTVMMLTVPEFEAVAMKNTRIVTKMLKVFSNQLRRIQHQLRNLLAGDEQVNPETGLYKIGEYYLKNKRYGQALYAYKRYLVYYPSGIYSSDAAKKAETAESFVSKYGGDAGLAASAGPARGPDAVTAGEAWQSDAPKPAPSGAMSDVAQQFYNAVSLVSQEKYGEAAKEFKKILDAGADPEYATKAEFEFAKCQFYLKQYEACARTFTSLVQRFPKHPDLKEALFFVARSYEERGDRVKSAGLYKRIVTMGTDDDPVVRRARKALKALESGEKA